MIERDKRGQLEPKVGHGRIQVNQRNLFNQGVPENLSGGQAIAAAENQDTLWLIRTGHRRMHQRLVVAVLVGRAELQVSAEEELEARAATFAPGS